MSNINNTIHNIPATIGSATAVMYVWGVSEWCSIVGAAISVLTYGTYVIFLLIKYRQERKAREVIHNEVEAIVQSKTRVTLSKAFVVDTPDVGSGSGRKSFRTRT